MIKSLDKPQYLVISNENIYHIMYYNHSLSMHNRHIRDIYRKQISIGYERQEFSRQENAFRRSGEREILKRNRLKVSLLTCLMFNS